MRKRSSSLKRHPPECVSKVAQVDAHEQPRSVRKLAPRVGSFYPRKVPELEALMRIMRRITGVGVHVGVHVGVQVPGHLAFEASRGLSAEVGGPPAGGGAGSSQIGPTCWGLNPKDTYGPRRSYQENLQQRSVRDGDQLTLAGSPDARHASMWIIPPSANVR